MSKYVLYRDNIETIEPDETETHAKIIEVMSVGLENIMANYDGRSVRISHAKAHGILRGELVVSDICLLN